MSTFRPNSPTVLVAMDSSATTMLRNWFDVLHREYFVVHLQNVGIINLEHTDVLDLDELHQFVERPYFEYTGTDNVVEAVVEIIRQLLSTRQQSYSMEFYWLCDVSNQNAAGFNSLLYRLKELHRVFEDAGLQRLLNGVNIHSTLLFVGHKDDAQERWSEFQKTLTDADLIRRMSAILLTAQHDGQVYHSEQVQYEWMEALTFSVLERDVSRRQELNQIDLFPSEGDLFVWKLMLVQDLERRIQEMYKRRQATKIVEHLLNSRPAEDLPIQSERITKFLFLWSQRFDLHPDSGALGEDINNILYPYMQSIDTLESRFEKMQHELASNHLCVSLERTYSFDESWVSKIEEHIVRLSNEFTQRDVMKYLTDIREQSDLKVDDWTRDLHNLHDQHGGVGLSPLLGHLLKEQQVVDDAYESNQQALGRFINQTAEQHPELSEREVRDELNSIQNQAQELWSSIPRLQTVKKLVYPLSPVLGALMTPIVLTFVEQQGVPEPRSVLTLTMLRALDDNDPWAVMTGLLTDPTEIITSLSALLLVPLHSPLFAWLALSIAFYFALQGWVAIKTKQMQQKLMRYFGLNGVFSARLQSLVYGINGKYLKQRQLLEMKLAEWISANVKRGNRGLAKYIDQITYTKIALEWLSEHGLSENDLLNSFDLDARLLPQSRDGWSIHSSKYPSLKYLLPPLDDQNIHGPNIEKPYPLWILPPENHQQVNRKVLYPHEFLSIVETKIQLDQLNLDDNAVFEGDYPFVSGITYSNMSEHHFVGSILRSRWAALSKSEGKFRRFSGSEIHPVMHSQYDYHHIRITVERVCSRVPSGVKYE